MCRHLAYLGPPVTLEELLLAPPHSLLHQSWAPRHQRYGTVNADGFGAGWWNLACRPEPARYRRPSPMWSDRSFASLAGVVAADAVVAAVRSATPPLPVDESGCAPFAAGQWLFSHNGVVDGWAAGTNVVLRSRLGPERAAALEGVTDSEVLFALILEQLERGVDAAAAVSGVVRSVAEDHGGRLNVLLGDGHRVVATTWGDTLFIGNGSGRPGVVVASEPYDDGPGWEPVPDHSLVEATGAGVTVTPLA